MWLYVKIFYMNNINIIHNTDNIELYVNLKLACRIYSIGIGDKTRRDSKFRINYNSVYKFLIIIK